MFSTETSDCFWGIGSCSMSSIARYSEIPTRPKESTSQCQISRGLRKMSCFDTNTTTDRPRFKTTFSTNSLPRISSGRTSSALHMDSVVKRADASALGDVLRIPHEDIAAQFTLIDFDLFKKIDLEELTTCGWIKKNKNDVAPNIVAYTRRFNHVSYWVTEEILNQDICKIRAEIISYFTRVCKRLYELNNLHSLFAIISGLRSASIYRLNSTWNLVPKRDKQSIDRFADIFADKDNWAKYREHLDSLRFPCVPYIGVYLTDLVYLSMANPSCSLNDNAAANNIFRIITTYQAESTYCHLPKDCPLQCHLRSIRFIDELLKFVEDDHYKKSLKLEPLQQSPEKFIAGHKKQSSWGNKPKFLAPIPTKDSSSAESARNLIDDSLLEKCEASPGDLDLSTPKVEVLGNDIVIEGCLRRKTLLKNGKKPLLGNGACGAWQRFWVQLWGSVLLYFPGKSLTAGSDRSDFKLEPQKMKSILGWLVQLADDPLHPDSFHLADPDTGTMYKFRTGTAAQAFVWLRALQECQKKQGKPSNLIKFD